MKDAGEFRACLKELNLDFDLVDAPRTREESAFSRPLSYTSAISGKTRVFENRWAILPMEGWDCLPTGAPSELTIRRWTRFAISGAKLFFGGEAAAVMQSGKANTRQMLICRDNIGPLRALLQNVKVIHLHRFDMDTPPYIGLQLTHSGRFAKPNDDKKPEPRTAYAHPLLDKKFHCSEKNVLTDGEVEDIIEHFIEGARCAQEAGFDFVDVKSAHGYLGYEFLTAHTRPGKFGGSFENRTRFFREIVEGIKREVPGLDIAIRLSLFDFVPFEKKPDGTGGPMEFEGNYPYALGGDGTGLGINLDETAKFIELAYSLGIRMIGSTAGSPYYNPHVQRPAAFPVVDGYPLVEDPLCGVARQIKAVAEIKKRFPEILFVGSGLTYLQDYLPLVGEWLLENGMTDFIGLGRMVLAYAEMPADYQAGKPLQKNKVCRTFGDCTNAPRAGLVSGCFPLDQYYKDHKDFTILRDFKAKIKG